MGRQRVGARPRNRRGVARRRMAGGVSRAPSASLGGVLRLAAGSRVIQSPAMNIRRVTVLGAGTMGHGIAHAAAAAGFDTAMYDVSRAAVEKGRQKIEDIFRKGVELGKIGRASCRERV